MYPKGGFHMENNDNKRRKKVISGTASLNRRDDKPVETNGPVGRKDGYQGRKAQFGAKKPTGGSEQSGSLLSSLFGASQSQNTGSQSSGAQNTQQTFTTGDLGGDTGSTGGTTGTTGSGRGLLKGGCMKT